MQTRQLSGTLLRSTGGSQPLPESKRSAWSIIGFFLEEDARRTAGRVARFGAPRFVPLPAQKAVSSAFSLEKALCRKRGRNLPILTSSVFPDPALAGIPIEKHEAQP